MTRQILSSQILSSQILSATPSTATQRGLDGKIVLVAGATRGAGRGIAVELGAAGATVYCTGRSTRADGASDVGRTEVIEDTAAAVTAAGGLGIWRRVDHSVPQQVEKLIKEIESEHGRLDVVIDDIGGEHLHAGHWDQPIWEHDLDAGLEIIRGMLDTHLITSHFALELLHRSPGGVHVELTDGHNGYNDGHYRVSAFFDLAKTGLNRLAYALGYELAKQDCMALSVSPGWLRSEAMLDAFGVTEDNWMAKSDASTGRDGEPPRDFVVSESPRFVGRGIAALAADPDRARWNQRSVTSYDLAEHYGLSDLDGSRPNAWAFITDVVEQHKPIDVTGYR